MTTYAKDYRLRTPGEAPVRREHVYPDTREQAISPGELKELGIASAQAWKAYAAELAAEGDSVKEFARRAGVTQGALQEDWRHRQVKLATRGRASRLSTLMRADFREVKAHFLQLAGLSEQAFALLLRTGPAPDGAPVENGEQADKAVAGIFKKIVTKFAGQGTPDAEGRARAFFQSIVKPKERKYACGWRSWSPERKWQLYYTLKNRLQAIMEKDGVVEPSTRGRNKSQREKRRSAAAAESAPRPRAAAPCAPDAQELRIFTVETDMGGERETPDKV